MKRAYLIEMTVLGGYLRKLLPMAFFVSLCTAIGSQSVVGVPAAITMMLFMVGAMSAAAYDEQNGWQPFRLTLPLSRRDVVLGRYAAIFTIGCCGVVIGLLAAAVMGATAAVPELSGTIFAAFSLTADTARAATLATFACMLAGSFVAGVITPVYFRFGQTKATQYLPMMTALLFVAFGLLVGSGALGDGALGLEELSVLLGVLETPAGLPCAVAVLVAASVVLLAVSAAVSLRLYEHREL